MTTLLFRIFIFISGHILIFIALFYAGYVHAFDGSVAPSNIETAQFRVDEVPYYDPRIDPRRYYPRGGRWEYGPREGFEGGGYPLMPQGIPSHPHPYAPGYRGPGYYQGYTWPRPYSPYYVPRRLGGSPYFGGYPPYEWWR